MNGLRLLQINQPGLPCMLHKVLLLDICMQPAQLRELIQRIHRLQQQRPDLRHAQPPRVKAEQRLRIRQDQCLRMQRFCNT